MYINLQLMWICWITICALKVASFTSLGRMYSWNGCLLVVGVSNDGMWTYEGRPHNIHNIEPNPLGHTINQ